MSRQTPTHRAFAGIDAHQLWGEVDSVIALNEDFLAALEKATRSWDEEESLIGPLIQKFATRFRHYGTYAALHGKAVSDITCQHH